MMPGLRKVVLSAMLRGTYSGAFLAAFAFFWTQGLHLADRAEAFQAWDQLFHYVVEGALAVGFASGIARLLAPANWLWNVSQGNAGAPVGSRSPGNRSLTPDFPVALGGVGIMYAGVDVRGMPLGCADWLFTFMVWWFCALYVLGLLLWLVGVARRRLRPSTSVGPVSHHLDWASVGLLIFIGPIAAPVLGYHLGTAVTLLPGASDWSLAPQYGIILGLAGEIVLGAVRSSLFPFGVKGGAEAERPDERETNPV
jgi:hypothetical protein